MLFRSESRNFGVEHHADLCCAISAVFPSPPRPSPHATVEYTVASGEGSRGILIGVRDRFGLVKNSNFYQPRWEWGNGIGTALRCRLVRDSASLAVFAAPQSLIARLNADGGNGCETRAKQLDQKRPEQLPRRAIVRRRRKSAWPPCCL